MSNPGVHKGTIRTVLPKRASTLPMHGGGGFPVRRYQRIPSNEEVARLVDPDTTPTGAVFGRLLRAMSTERLEEAWYVLQGQKARLIHEELRPRYEKEKKGTRA